EIGERRGVAVRMTKANHNTRSQLRIGTDIQVVAEIRVNLHKRAVWGAESCLDTPFLIIGGLNQTQHIRRCTEASFEEEIMLTFLLHGVGERENIIRSNGELRLNDMAERRHCVHLRSVLIGNIAGSHINNLY